MLQSLHFPSHEGYARSIVSCADTLLFFPFFSLVSFAFVNTHGSTQAKPSVSALTSYLLSCIASNTTCSESQDLINILNAALKPDGKGVGLLLSERLINMPVQVMPQLLSQVGSEIKHAQSKVNSHVSRPSDSGYTNFGLLV